MNYGLNDCTLDGEDLVCSYNDLVNGADLLALSPDGRTAYLSKATYIRPLQPQAQAKVQATLANTRNQFSIYVCPNILDFPIVCGPPTGSNLDGPSGIAISPDGKTAYVTNIAGDFGGGSIDAVVICTIEGLHLNCSQPTGSDFKYPTGIALNPDGSIVYVANYVPEGSVTACEVSGDVLKNCQVNSIGAFGSFGIAVSRDGKTAYISTQNSTLGGITICEVSDLTVGPCQSELNPDDVFSIPGYLSLNKDGTQLFASSLYYYHYYTSINAGGAVSTCSISGESLVSCSNATAINYASGIAAY